MRIEFDRRTNAAYIYFVSIAPGGVAWSYPCDPLGVKGMINLDFDVEGKLVGIEVLDATGKLPSTVIEAAETVGGSLDDPD